MMRGKDVTPHPPRQIVREIVGVSALALALFFFIALFTYHPLDPSWNTATNVPGVRNAAGKVGAYLADLVFQIFGLAGFLLPPYALVYAAHCLRARREDHRALRVIGGVLLLLTVAGLLRLAGEEWRWGEITYSTGGVIGHVLSRFLLENFSLVGALVVLGTLFIISLIIATRFSLLALGQGVMETVASWRERREAAEERRRTRAAKAGEAQEERGYAGVSIPQGEPEIVEEVRRVVTPAAASPTGVSAAKQETLPFPPESGIQQRGVYQLPPLSLLTPPAEQAGRASKEEIFQNSAALEEKLRHFGVEGRVTQVYPGPVVTMYEYEPAPGIKINRIMSLADDLALALRALSVRVVGPIPGKAVVGIEVPNQEREGICLREILSAPEFTGSVFPLPLALGKEIFGMPVVADLATMPHLLIAGATGSGKSMGLNVMILSLLYRATPAEVRFLLIDPKMLELTAYEGIPHLLTPVITQPKKAAEALLRVVGEMEYRYKLLAEKGVRNIEGYNRQIAADSRGRHKGREGLGAEAQPLPYLIVVIDELADLMMLAAREVEDAIARLAQMARAAGIHLILATQRPSVDVLTGVIKANFSARIAYQVPSRIDSRTILDTGGAEQLLGRGDMLYLQPGTARPVRIHGPFVSEEEVRRVVEFVRSQGSPQYEEFFLQPREADRAGGDVERDELYQRAVELVLTTRQASISMVQRRLRIGYNRAARMIEMMEEDGIVTRSEGGRPREVIGRRPPAL